MAPPDPAPIFRRVRAPGWRPACWMLRRDRAARVLDRRRQSPAGKDISGLPSGSAPSSWRIRAIASPTCQSGARRGRAASACSGTRSAARQARSSSVMSPIRPLVVAVFRGPAPEHVASELWPALEPVRPRFRIRAKSGHKLRRRRRFGGVTPRSGLRCSLRPRRRACHRAMSAMSCSSGGFPSGLRRISLSRGRTMCGRWGRR